MTKEELRALYERMAAASEVYVRAQHAYASGRTAADQFEIDVQYGQAWRRYEIARQAYETAKEIFLTETEAIAQEIEA